MPGIVEVHPTTHIIEVSTVMCHDIVDIPHTLTGTVQSSVGGLTGTVQSSIGGLTVGPLAEVAAAVQSWGGGGGARYVRVHYAICQAHNKIAVIYTRVYGSSAFRITCSSSNTHSVIIAPILLGAQSPPTGILGGQSPPCPLSAVAPAFNVQ